MLIDQKKDTSKLFLILCGSSMSFMEHHVLGYNSPLYGRRTAQLKIKPFDFFESLAYFKKFDYYETALLYGIIGGTPQYLLQMDDTKSIEQNVKNTLLNPNSFLFEEPTNLLKQEVREQSTYNAIISAIANGASRLSDIANKVGEDTSKCSMYLKNLISLGIIRKERPMLETSNKKTVYSIEDPLFRFWYRFIPENMSLIERDLADVVYRRIEPYFNEYMGAVFEEISKQYLWKQLMEGKTNVLFYDLGRWWGNDSKRKEEAEIDILGIGDHEVLIFGECKWNEADVDIPVLDKLIERSELFPRYTKYYYIFAKHGFTKRCIEKAASLENVTLVRFLDMI